jgi:hypothetical protein
MIEWPAWDDCIAKRMQEYNRFVFELEKLSLPAALDEFNKWAITQPEGNTLTSVLRRMLQQRMAERSV